MTALLVVDIGNTNTVLGLYEGRRLAADWRLATRRDATADEIGILLTGLLGAAPAPIERAIAATVVPSLQFPWKTAFRKYLRLDALFVEPGIRTGMPILYDNPQEVGADRIVNAVAAFEKYGGPCIVVDFGTATTFDVVNASGEYAGGVITPGVMISAEALFSRAARLSRVEIRRPTAVIGKTTTASIQSGLYFGYLGLVDGLIERIAAEMEGEPKVIATGGLAELLGGASSRIGTIDPHLTLDGLRILDERNRSRRD
ncbi:MAG TPA: type III pantothenate kinase [Thermoanaerobaculia bacterium]|nr:type III pantothenate kinase [Thermoanaerobaculia bacterium]